MLDPADGPQRPSQKVVVVAFWRRPDHEVEFLVPVNGDYLDLLSIQADSDSASVARAWVRKTLGIDPRSNARVFAGSLGDVVAFTITSTEMELLPGFAWQPLRLIPSPAYAVLKHIAERL